MPVTLQAYADEIVATEYRQPLKTLQAALAVNGWAEVDFPTCCGEQVEISNFIGLTYHIECKTCGRFARDIGGPMFDNASVRLLNEQAITDLDTDARWIVGVAPDAPGPKVCDDCAYGCTGPCERDARRLGEREYA